MTPEDRELLHGLRRQQLELRQALERLDAQLENLEDRNAESPSVLPPLPPIPPHDLPPPFLPPVPMEATSHLPPVPIDFPPFPRAKPPVRESRHTFEFQIGRWLTRLGAAFGVIALVLLFSYSHHFIFKMLGPTGAIFLSAAMSLGIVVWGRRFERKSVFFGRAVTAMALTWLYVTTYAACYSEHYRLVSSPFVAGCLLLLWSAYVLIVAERRHSQGLALLAITLAYFSTAINPIGRFTMAADLLLAGTAITLMIRQGWSALAYFSLIGSYLAMLRRLVIDANGEFVFDSGRVLHFGPYATYLTFTWLVFTAGVWFCSSPRFRGGIRFAFLSLNNSAWAFLLLFTAYISGYGHATSGWILLSTGFILLVTSRFVGWTAIEPEAVMAAYATQGLALFTGGVIVIFTGITRGVMLTLETILLGCAGTFSDDRILLITTYVAGFFATMFLVWEIAINSHHPWLLGFSGALVMLINAWMARSEIRHSPKERSTLVSGAAYYCTLAVGLILTALCVEQSDTGLPPALAIAAMILTFSIYFFSLFELPPIAQILLLVALGLVIFPIDTGEEWPWWTTGSVAVITLVMATWWARQRITRSSNWTSTLVLIYSLALAALVYETVRPWADLDGWMIIASLLSVGFLLWGTFTRVWQLAIVGQLFLAIALYHFFIPPEDGSFPWTWRAALMPLIVVFSTARAAHAWLDLYPESISFRRTSLRSLAYGYQLLALAMLIRWISATVPPLDQIAVFLILGTLVLSWNARISNIFGIRCSYVLTLLGTSLFLENLDTTAAALDTFFIGFGFFCLLTQPILVRRRDNFYISAIEHWMLILLSVASCFMFVSVWTQIRWSPGYLTMNWALYGLFLFLIGPLVRVPSLRLCGLAVLGVAIGRAGFHDFWSLSSGYQILTAIALMLVTLSVGYLIVRSVDPLKK